MGVEYKDYYKLLDVNRSATKEEISKAFKKLARKYHPDLNQDNKEAESKFKELNEAYEVLKDDEKRKLYDQLGSNWQHGQQFKDFQGNHGFENFQGFSGGSFNNSGFSDFFENLFGAGAGRGFESYSFGPTGSGMRGPGMGGSGMRQSKGQDVESELSLTLEEAYKGGKKKLTLREPGQPARTLEVNIPARVKDGTRIRLAGQGSPAQSWSKAGDLILRVHLLEHNIFEREDKNIIYELPLAPWEAALGAKIKVPTLEGEVEINVPAGVSSGTKLRVRGRGLGVESERGDQFIRINVKIPRSLTDEEKQLWEELAKISSFQAR